MVIKTLQRFAVSVSLLAFGITGALRPWKDRSAPPVDHSARAPQAGGLRECPETWSKQGELVKSPAFGRIANVPEFHDCQRFVLETPGGLRYDSLYAIFAVDNIARAWLRLTARVDIPETRGELFGIIYTFGGSSPLADGDALHGGNYQALGIASGFNCLYLYNPAHLTARMVPYGPKSTCPNNMADANPHGLHTDLIVHQIPPPPGLSANDIPEVARWDWDPLRKSQYIGIYCGKAWCEVGGSGSAKYLYPPDAPPETSLPAEQRRVAEIPGWYDEQRLAIGPPDHPVPSNIWGTIFPVGDLWRKSVSDFQGRWVPVAYATVTADYNGKIILRRTAKLGPPEQPGAVGVKAGVKANIIEFCKGPLATAPGIEGAGGCTFKPGDGPVPVACHGPIATDAPWWRRVRNPTTGAVLLTRCLKRWDHTAMSAAPIPVPGTARWRWIASDEYTWGRCGGGCCQ